MRSAPYNTYVVCTVYSQLTSYSIAAIAHLINLQCYLSQRRFRTIFVVDMKVHSLVRLTKLIIHAVADYDQYKRVHEVSETGILRCTNHYAFYCES